MGATAMRAYDIGAIGRDDLTAVWKEMGWRGYCTQEPIDIPLEQAVIVNVALEIHRTEHGLTDDDLASVAGVSALTLSELFPEHFAPPAN